MRSLKESIIRSNNAGVFKLNQDMIHPFKHTNLKEFMDTIKMMKDAEKIAGRYIENHSDAFAVILDNSLLLQSDIKQLIGDWSNATNDIADVIFKEKFKDYLKNPDKWHFYWIPSRYKKGDYTLGVIVSSSFKSQNILDFHL